MQLQIYIEYIYINIWGKCIIHGLSIWNVRRQFAASHQLVSGSARHWGNNSIKLQLSATAEQDTTGYNRISGKVTGMESGNGANTLVGHAKFLPRST